MLQTSASVLKQPACGLSMCQSVGWGLALKPFQCQYFWSTADPDAVAVTIFTLAPNVQSLSLNACRILISKPFLLHLFCRIK